MITKQGKLWVAHLGNEDVVCVSQEVAQRIIDKHSKKDWKAWTPPKLEDLPLPEVREYDSMEEAIAEED